MFAVLLNNRYRILKEIGRGGFGQTFLAIDTHMPSERRCAIKQLQPILGNQQDYRWVQERFQREAAILEQLSRGCRQIPQLYAYFAESGTFYLVQEWIEGVTLTQKVQKEGDLPAEAVKELLVSLLPVLDYVHGHRMIHRDLKPDNIIVRASDGKPVLIDFGGVKEAMGTIASPHSGSFHSSMTIGTPGYMPSEQAAGRPVYSSDLYALALTAIYLLTGKHPHQLETDPHTGEILWRQEVPKLHSHLLAAVIDRAVRFHPRDRFASAQEMLAALQDPSQAIATEVEPLSTAETVVATPPSAAPAAPVVAPTVNLRAETAAKSVPTPSTDKGVDRLVAGVFLLGFMGVIAAAIGLGTLQMNKEPSTTSGQGTPSRPSAQPSQTESPSVARSPQMDTSKTPTVVEPETTPEPTPQPRQPARAQRPSVIVPTVPTTRPTSKTPLWVPVFATGTSAREVQAALGTPASVGEGYWENTQEVRYTDYIPNRVDLIYVFNDDSQKLLQTDVFFDPSVEFKVMNNTLKRLVGTPSPSVEQALRQVYEGQTDLRSFSEGNLKGMIRQQGDRLSISVWHADLAN